MKLLTRSIQSSIQNLKKPESDPEFEDICLDLFKYILKGHKIGIHNKIGPSYITYKGAKGDKQYGFDIRCKSSLAVAQCKLVKELKPNDLDKELKKLKEYTSPVSHYFFLVSSDKVKSSLQDWVDEKNQETEENSRVIKRFPVEPAVRLPWFHILGWTEIKNYLLESTLLSIKWGALPAATNKYYHLQGLDYEKLEYAIRSFRAGCKSQPCSTTISGFESITNTLNTDEISTLGTEEKIHSSTLEGIEKFIEIYNASLSVLQTHTDTMKKLESEDLIIFEEGLSQLNNISFHSARIYAIPYLKRAHNAARALINLLCRDENYFHSENVIEDQEDGFEEIFTGYLFFNFSAPNEVHPPWYIEPKSVQHAAAVLVGELNSFHIVPAE